MENLFLDNISVGLITNFIWTILGKSINFTVDKVQKVKDRKFLNKPFVLAFKKTCEYFSDSKTSPYDINKNILEKLLSLDEIAINMFFYEVDINIEQIKTNSDFSFMKLGLKNFIAINYSDEKYDEEFYDDWACVFKENYKTIFIELCSKDNILFNKFLLDVVGVTLENLEYIKNRVEKIDSTTASIYAYLTTEMPKIQEKLDTNDYINQIDTDILLTPLKIFFDDKNFNQCLITINDNYLNKIDNYPDEIKAKIYNYKGACELNLDKLGASEESFKTSLSYKPMDKALANLCKCYLNSNRANLISTYIDNFEDKNSKLYKQIKFYELFYSQNNNEAAEEHLEINKSEIENYNHLKARLLQAQKAPYDEIIKYYTIYSEECPEDKIVKYELIASRFAELFENNLIHFSFGITMDYELEIYSEFNNKLNQESLNLLITDIDEFLKEDIEKFYRISLITMYSILQSQKADISSALKYKSEILLNMDCISDGFNANNACMVCFLQKDFENAYEIYNKYFSDENNILALILFGLKEYNECNKVLTENDINDLEVIKLLSNYKLKDWGAFFLEIKGIYASYTISDRMAVLDLCFHEKEYDFCKDKYIDLAEKIINENIALKSPIIIMLSERLNFFHMVELSESLLVYYWNKYPSSENFEIGLKRAIKLYNSKLFSECLLILNQLSEYQPSNNQIKELYKNIDVLNFSYDGIIKDYEDGNKDEKYLYYVAIGYIHKKEFEKANEVIERLKYSNNKNEYYHAKGLLLSTMKEYETLFKVLIEANEQYPDDLDIKKMTIEFTMSRCNDVKLSPEFKVIYNKAFQFLVEKGVFHMFQLSNENPMEDLNAAINKIQPIEEYLQRKKSIEELFEQYNSFIMPIQILFPFVNSNKIGFWIEFLNNPLQVKNLFAGIQLNNLNAKFEILDKNKNILVGFESLILLKELEIENEVKEIFNLKISSFTVKDIKVYLDEKENLHTEGTINRDKNNNLRYSQKSNIEEKYIPYLKSVLVNYEKLNYNSANIKDVSLIEAAEKIECKGLFDEAIISSQYENIVVWLDGTLSQIYNEYNIETVSIIDILEYLTYKKIFTKNKLVQLKVRLCSLNCKFIPVSENDLLYALKDSFDNYIVLLDVFNSKIYTLEYLVSVISNLILKLNDEENLKFQMPLILKSLFDKLMFLYPNTDFALPLLRVLSINYIYLNNDLQINIGLNMLSALGSNMTAIFYKSLLEAISRAIPLIDANRDIFMSEIIANVPEGIKEQVKNYAINNCNHSVIIDIV